MYPANMPSIFAVELFCGTAGAFAVPCRYPDLRAGDVLAIVIAFSSNSVDAGRWQA
jgi:hypothetical protein